MALTENEIKELARLKNRKERYQQKRFLVEGVRSVSEVLKSDFKIEHILVCEAELSKTGREFIDSRSHKSVELLQTRKFRKLSSTVSSQGIIAVVRMTDTDDVPLEKFKNLIMVAEKISDPTNLGSLIRSATAFNAGILIGEGSADIYSTKVISSSAGILFRSQFEQTQDLFTKLIDIKKAGYSIWGADGGGEALDKINRIPSRLAIVIGNEAFGIAPQLHDRIDRMVKIPIVRQVESLSAQVAGAIMVYELSRRMKLVK